MAALMIADYLRTQGLKLPLDAVQVAHLAAQTVIQMGVAEIDTGVLWYQDAEGALAEVLPPSSDNRHWLGQAHLALDSLYSRFPCRAAALYAPMADGRWWRLLGQGEVLETQLPQGEDALWQHVASRSAHSGWLNQVDDVARWLDWGELRGEQHRRCGSQLALPIYGGDGRVLGVLYAEDHAVAAFDEARLIYWVGLALALVPLLQQWQIANEATHTEEEQNHESC